MKWRNEEAMAMFEGRGTGITWSTRNVERRNEGIMAMLEGRRPVFLQCKGDAVLNGRECYGRYSTTLYW